MFRHSIRVRYGEVDQQGVVFNAHYLAYVDDALERWLAPIGDLRRELGWDMMLKRASLEWQGSLSSGDQADIDLGVTRWGRSSWEVGYRGSRDGKSIFTARVLYISVRLGTNTPVQTPDRIRAFMGEAIDPELPGADRSGG